MDLKQHRQKHKQLHGENALKLHSFYLRLNRGRSVEDAVKYPKGHKHGGSRTRSKYTIKQFGEDLYPGMKYYTFYHRYRRSWKLQRDYRKACKSVEKH